MRIFITGATGYIGETITEDLIKAGHQVLGLARSEQSAEKLKAMGAEVHRGNLSDLACLKQGAALADGVIHTAFTITDWNQLDAEFAQDRAAVEAMLTTLAGTGKPFLFTSGSGVLADTGEVAVDETVATDPTGLFVPRAAIEQTVLEASESGVRSIVIRPGVVYGKGGKGVWHLLAQLASQANGAVTIGEGHNVWSLVHVNDLADLYLSALERGPAGTLFNAASEEMITMRDIASAIARTLNLTGPPTVWRVEDIRPLLGPLADGLTVNKRISSALAQRILDWRPHRPGIIEEIDTGSYSKALNNISE